MSRYSLYFWNMYKMSIQTLYRDVSSCLFSTFQLTGVTMEMKEIRYLGRKNPLSCLLFSISGGSVVSPSIRTRDWIQNLHRSLNIIQVHAYTVCFHLFLTPSPCDLEVGYYGVPFLSVCDL